MNTAEDTLSAILACYPQKEQQEQILRAYRIADDAMKDKLRENRHPFIEHPLGVARIVAEDIHLGYESVIAVFLHETIRFYPEVTQSLPKGAFSPEIIDIAQSLNKIAAIKPKETRLEAENYKRLIVSYSRDPRVMLIKIADRLDVMRNIELLPKTSQERKVTETMFLYIPIAHQLGLYGIKTELENIFFRCTEPEKYREINNKLKATAAEREELLNAFLIPIKRKLSEAGIKVTYKQRTKAAWSIWKKMQKQDIPFEKVMDLLAVRLIIDTPADSLEKEHELCWKAYSIVTDEYRPDTSRLRDWISKPKSSGYESLHITVQFRGDIFVEVQIRTRRMDDEAENGHASHWAYKGIKEEKGLTPWLQSVRNILESDNRNDYEYVSRFLSEDVFVFTPDGELRRLPKGATVLDFAFNIHTNLGLKCVGATIDGRPASIKDRLSTGQVVEIKSGKNQRPSPDWLNFVVTSKARNKIKLKLKEEELKKAATGRELLERRLKNWKMELPDEDLTILCKKYKLKTISDFYAAIADEKVDIMDVKSYISRKQQGEEEAAAIPSSQTPKDNEAQQRLLQDGPLLQPHLRRRGLRLRLRQGRHQDPPHVLSQRRPPHRELPLPHPESALEGDIHHQQLPDHRQGHHRRLRRLFVRHQDSHGLRGLPAILVHDPESRPQRRRVRHPHADIRLIQFRPRQDHLRHPQDPRSAVGSQNFKIEREHGTTGRRIHPH